MSGSSPGAKAEADQNTTAAVRASLARQVAEIDFLCDCIYCDEFYMSAEEQNNLAAARRFIEEDDEDEQQQLPPLLSFSLRLLDSAPTCVDSAANNAETPASEEELIAKAIQPRPYNFSLAFTFPRRYPKAAPLQWRLDPTQLCKDEYNALLKFIPAVVKGGGTEEVEEEGATTITKASATTLSKRDDEEEEEEGGNELTMIVADAVKHRVLEMKQECAEEAFVAALEQQQRDALAQEYMSSSSFAAQLASSRLLGRRSIYYHHIRCSAKRQCIVSWARTLSLSGISKIGYPGILVVEGPEEGCAEYVRCLQRLRWKLMVVRGEEVIDIDKAEPDNEGHNGRKQQQGKSKERRSIDDFRKFPGKGRVVETDDSSELAEYCRQYGLEDLFKTSMKIYK